MSGLPIWIKLPFFIAATAYFVALAWRLRPVDRNPAGRPGGFTCTAAVAVFTGFNVLDLAVRLAGGNLPRLLYWTPLGALLVAGLAWFWAHVEDLRAEWSGRTDGPNPAEYPTQDWKWAALWSTLIAFPLMVAFIRWNMPYVGILGMCTSAVALFSLAHWAWRRWEIWVIHRIQARPPRHSGLSTTQ